MSVPSPECLPDVAATQHGKSLRKTAAGLIAAAALLAGLTATGALTARYMTHVRLPGCDVDGPCGELETSPWATLAGCPVAYLGFAYFLALAAAWVGAPRDGPGSLVHLARFGVLVSAGFTVLLVLERRPCPYCLATHAANLLLWLSLEWAGRTGRAFRMRRTLIAAATFLAVLGGLGWLKGKLPAPGTVAAASARDQAAGAPGRSDPPRGTSASDPVRQTRGPDAPSAKLVFIERFRQGPADAAVRVIVFGDYQCDYCTKVEAQVRALAARHPGLVSVSMKHFPLCAECNWVVRKTRHSNGCRAAAAAQAAGLLGGGDGFWHVHDWLCRRQGAFTEDELRAALPGLGFRDVDRFMHAMTGDEVRQRIYEDITEGNIFLPDKLPVIVVNGEQLRGWDLGRVLDEQIEARLPKR